MGLTGREDEDGHTGRPATGVIMKVAACFRVDSVAQEGIKHPNIFMSPLRGTTGLRVGMRCGYVGIAADTYFEYLSTYGALVSLIPGWLPSRISLALNLLHQG